MHIYTFRLFLIAAGRGYSFSLITIFTPIFRLINTDHCSYASASVKIRVLFVKK